MSKHTTLGFALAACIAAAAPSAFAQDAKAAEILAKTRKALGGAKLDALKTLAVEATAQRNMGQMQMSADVEMLLELPDKYVKSESSRGGMVNMSMNTGFNGDKAILPANATTSPGGMTVIRMGPGGQIQGDGPKLTDEQKAELNKTSVRAARTDISRFMLGWFGIAHPSLQATYTYAGEAESPDGKAHVIDVKDADGFEARLFVDQNNYLPLMVTYKSRQARFMTSSRTAATGQGTATTHGAPQVQTRPAPTQMSEEERKKAEQDTGFKFQRDLAESPMVEHSIFFDDWREVGGITFPHVMRRAAGGETSEEWTISKVKLNAKIDPKKFAADTK